MDQAVRSSVSSAAARGEGWVGRQRELADLRGDVAKAGLDTLGGKPAARCRVLLIAGQPGSGRTALAERFAREVSADYPDGVLRARLTDPGGGVVSLERAARDLLDALGVNAPAGADQDGLTAALRAALESRRVLLLLDDVAAAEQLVELVPDNRRCLVLATAEGPLTGVPDVRPCAIGGLDVESAVTLLASRAGSEIRITVDPTAAERLAMLCAQQPAALLLMGGWLAAHPHCSVLEAIRALTAVGGEPRPLARVLTLVMQALPRTTARMARLLTLASAGLVDAHFLSALAGCSVHAARSELENFARLGLLRPLGEDGYQIPGCLAPLLRESLEAHERPADIMLAQARMWERMVRRLRACWAITEPVDSTARKELAEEPLAIRFASRQEAGRWLDSRLPALLAAVRSAVASGDLDNLARRLIAGLAQALDAHRRPEAAAPVQYRLHELVLVIAERRVLHAERAAALLYLGDLDAMGARYGDALTRYRAALEATRKVPSGPGGSQVAEQAMDSLGSTYAKMRDWPRAADWYGRALTLVQTRGDLAESTRLQSRIGAVQLCAGQWTEALGAWRAAAAGYRRLRDPGACAHALSEVARAQEHAGRPREALRTCQDALRWAERAGQERLRAALYLRLADTCERLGDVATAVAHRAAARPLLAGQRTVEREQIGEKNADSSQQMDVSQV